MYCIVIFYVSALITVGPVVGLGDHKRFYGI
jgi:hypothetical protein